MADKQTKDTKENGRTSESSRKKRDRSRSSSEDKERRRRKSSKQKSRKRSHSDSESNTSSSSQSDHEKRKVEKKVKKKKRRSSSSDSSPSESDDKHSKSKRKHKKDKKVKKKKKKERKAKNVGAVDQKKYGAYGIIRESDMFVKQQEFYAWLYEVKNINHETLPKFEIKKIFEGYMEDYNTATLPHKKYYNLERWEAKRLQKSELKALKQARETSISIADDEKRHDFLHRKTAGNKHATPSRQQLLEMQQELRRRQDEEYRKKAGLS